MSSFVRSVAPVGAALVSSLQVRTMTLFHSGLCHCAGRCAHLWSTSAQSPRFPEGRTSSFCSSRIHDARSQCLSSNGWDGAEFRLGTLGSSFCRFWGEPPFLGSLPTSFMLPVWPSIGPLVRVFDTGVAFLLKDGFLCQAPVKEPWAGMSSSHGSATVASQDQGSGFPCWDIRKWAWPGLEMIRCRKGPFRGSPHGPGSACLSLWLKTFWQQPRVTDLRSVLSLPGPGVQGVSAH